MYRQPESGRVEHRDIPRGISREAVGILAGIQEVSGYRARRIDRGWSRVGAARRRKRHHRSFRDPSESQRPGSRHPDLTRDHTRCVDRGNPPRCPRWCRYCLLGCARSQCRPSWGPRAIPRLPLGANGGCKHDVVPEAQELNTALGASFEAASGALTGTGDYSVIIDTIWKSYSNTRGSKFRNGSRRTPDKAISLGLGRIGREPPGDDAAIVNTAWMRARAVSRIERRNCSVRCPHVAMRYQWAVGYGGHIIKPGHTARDVDGGCAGGISVYGEYGVRLCVCSAPCQGGHRGCRKSPPNDLHCFFLSFSSDSKSCCMHAIPYEPSSLAANLGGLCIG